ncbi:hypothetical protein FJV41_36345 [Myxococcus llanfairpwllgwyngyllgogerychwyrndrobwllllantysiliogogogochensis]|uniref:Uncharacterized protein n=1 Tax=Myxococcus llanfairpwllgwyngyllgogerychwyrndrobwllllantysiliogogogochensis TaxID=2590453 RepID=A0A540WRI9_9BACT|nr:hypothetical protein [Myxococcus llanfairpwllgwyngyllgogerychwyrndrobwllllantysiliogogogochensis]TQF11024.1 hypothetical protein FJV41_36345 [Myxococcus llanfairpwllgwyngyllgogerychwyrndrobwllllantysiliogogogochensis]
MSNLIIQKADGSVETTSGQTLLFSPERFERDIVQGDSCFICGISRSSGQSFNDEHILPRWLLRKFDLFQSTITLPNNTKLTYGKYTLPCCTSCNSIMGQTLENPIRELCEGGLERVGQFFEKNGPTLLFCWLSLIFLKTHLKDSTLYQTRDRRSGDLRRIGDAYDHTDLHHIHVIARSFHTQSTLRKEAFGSLLILPAKQASGSIQPFDFADLYISKSILLRINDFCLIAALDDSCGALSLFMNDLKRIRAPLEPAQLREIFAHISFISANLKERPLFHSTFDKDGHTVTGSHPSDVQLNDPPTAPFGEFLFAALSNVMQTHPDREQISALIREGKYSFLFDADGNQIDDSVILRP